MPKRVPKIAFPGRAGVDIHINFSDAQALKVHAAYSSVREAEPFAAVILCTADHDKVDDRTRSKWSRVLRYAAERKAPDERLRDFIKRKGGINECAARFARRLGRKANCVAVCRP
jgi:hypothetical protein